MASWSLPGTWALKEPEGAQPLRCHPQMPSLYCQRHRVALDQSLTALGLSSQP